MAGQSLPLKLDIQAGVSGAAEFRKFADEIEALGGNAADLRTKAAALDAEFGRLAEQQDLITAFKRLSGEAKTAEQALQQSQDRTRDLALASKQSTANIEGVENALRNARRALAGTFDPKEAKTLQTEIKALEKELNLAEKEATQVQARFNSSRQATQDWKEAVLSQKLALQQTGQAMNAAGLDSQKLEVSEARVALALNETSKAFTGLQTDARQTAAALAQFSTSGNATEWAAQGAVQAGKFSERVEDVGKSSDRTGSLLGKLGPAIAAVFAFDKIKDFIGSLIDVEAKYGKLEATLRSVTDSEKEAAAAAQLIADFQADAPIFSIEELTKAYVTLKNLGLQPTEESLRSYGNTAASVGKSLEQFTEAVADAATGEFERLKEFGIKSAQEGDKVRFTFQGVTTEVGKSAKEIEAYLLQIGQTTFADGIKNQSEQAAGAIGRISTAWEGVLKALADSTGIKTALNAVADGFGWLKDQISANSDVAGKSVQALEAQHDALVRLKGGVEQGGAASQWYAAKLAEVNAALDAATQAEAAAAPAVENTAKAQQLARQEAEQYAAGLQDQITKLDALDAAQAARVKGLDAEYTGRKALITAQSENLQQTAQELTAAGRTVEAHGALKQSIDLVGQARLLDIGHAQAHAVESQRSAEAARAHADVIAQQAAALDGISPKEQQAIDEARAEASARQSAADQARAHLLEISRLPAALSEVTNAQALQNSTVKGYYNEAFAAVEAAKRMGTEHMSGRASTDQLAAAMGAASAAVARLQEASDFYSSGAAARYVTATHSMSAAAAELTAQEQRADTARRQFADSEKSSLESVDGFSAAVSHQAETFSMMSDGFGAAMLAVRQYSTYLADQIQHLGDANSSWQIYERNVNLANQALARVTDERTQIKELTARIQEAADSGRGLARAAQTSTAAFGDLDKAQLSGLESAVDAVRAKVQGLREDAKATYADLQNQADELAGNRRAIEQRQYEAQREELRVKLAAAQAAGDSESIRTYNDSLGLLDTIHRRKMAALEGKAKGGPVKLGQQVVVGEEGPEVYVKKATGEAWVVGVNGPGTWIVPEDGTLIPAGQQAQVAAASSGDAAIAQALAALSLATARVKISRPGNDFRSAQAASDMAATHFASLYATRNPNRPDAPPLPNTAPVNQPAPVLNLPPPTKQVTRPTNPTGRAAPAPAPAPATPIVGDDLAQAEAELAAALAEHNQFTATSGAGSNTFTAARVDLLTAKVSQLRLSRAIASAEQTAARSKAKVETVDPHAGKVFDPIRNDWFTQAQLNEWAAQEEAAKRANIEKAAKDRAARTSSPKPEQPASQTSSSGAVQTIRLELVLPNSKIVTATAGGSDATNLLDFLATARRSAA